VDLTELAALDVGHAADLIAAAAGRRGSLNAVTQWYRSPTV
jgi:hypothetical protein